jgi:hypothetical protein
VEDTIGRDEVTGLANQRPDHMSIIDPMVLTATKARHPLDELAS